MKTPAFVRLLGSLTALTLAAPALAQEGGGSVSGFQLPSEQATPRSQAQGPVDADVPPPRIARPAPTPAPAPPPSVETVDPGASRTATGDPLAAIDALARDRAAQAQPSATPSGAATTAAVPSPSATATLPGAAPTTLAPAGPRLDLPRAAAPRAITASAPVTTPAGAGGIAWWPWLLALVGVGAVGAAAGWFWRGRRAEAPLLIEAIERPAVPPRAPTPLPEPTGPPAELPKVALSRKPVEPVAPRPAPPAAAAAEEDDAPERPLRIALEPARLSVSLLKATLAYRILLTNQGDTTLHDITIDGDMISAHASLSPDEQLAAPNSALENRHLVRTLAPGETHVVGGEFALPLPLIRPIRKGDAALFVPLARLRIVARREGGAAGEVLVQTSVVGQRSVRPGGGLRPFRLDLGPRIYSELGQRAFA